MNDLQKMCLILMYIGHGMYLRYAFCSKEAWSLALNNLRDREGSYLIRHTSLTRSFSVDQAGLSTVYDSYLPR